MALMGLPAHGNAVGGCVTDARTGLSIGQFVVKQQLLPDLPRGTSELSLWLEFVEIITPDAHT